MRDQAGFNRDQSFKPLVLHMDMRWRVIAKGIQGDVKTMTILKSRPRLTQKRQLLGLGLAAEDGVAVGVAAKALNDCLVALLEAQGVFEARLRKQEGGLGVHQGGLAVHVGHVGKAALRQGQAAVLPTGQQFLRQRQGKRVLRKGLGGVAVHIARELVEHQDLGQAPLGRGAPGKQLTTRRRLQRGAEAGADGVVQGGVFGEVVLWGEFGEPEVDNRFR